MSRVTAPQKMICPQSFLRADRRVLNGAFPNKRQNPFVRMAGPQGRRQSILAEVSGPRLKLGHIEQLS